jgi:glucosamine-6-phosphate deaminase
MYRELVRLSREGIADLSQTVVFNLDEYFGLPPDHPQSFRRYMKEHLLRHMQVREAHIPDSLASDPEAECRRYEELIASRRGIDLAVLGLGINGHIAFNEPGTPWESLTHLAELSPETRRREAQRFGGLEQVPHRAITMGIRTIMNARSILLLASGKEKAEIVRRSLLGPVTPEVPASVLQLHPNVTVLLDRAAAPELPEQAPYLAIEPLLASGCPAPSGGP